MRIIGGRLKGRQLKAFKADHIRPTTDRVKESLFNILQAEIPEARILDLFAGTGNLGIEAHSRGASEVIAVESHPKSIEIIKKNLEALQLSGIQVVRKDVFQFLKGPLAPPFDIIFVDPPFTEVLADKVMQALADGRWVKLSGWIAIESAKKEPIADVYGSLSLQDRRNYGDKVLSLFQKVREE